MSAENSFEYGSFKIKPLKSSSNLKEIDLGAKSIASFSFYENVLSPGVTARISFAIIDITKSSGLELYGGEELLGSINVPDFQGGEINFSTPGKGLRIRTIQSLKESTKSVYNLELTSYETLMNEIVRVPNRFDGNVGVSAEKIFRQLKSNKTIVTEKSSNNYSFVGNNKRPFDLLNFLCPKAVAPDKKSPGYFFFETQDGFVFKSINTLLKGGTNVPIYTQEDVTNANRVANKYRILNSYIEKNNDVLNSLRLGMYANKSLFYNLYTNEPKFVDFQLKQKYNGEIVTSSGNLTDTYPPLPGNMQDFPSRYFVRTLDVGALDKTGKLSKDSLYPDLPKYQAEAVVRYNLLFSQILKITIPCNPSLRAGQIIECRIPETASQMQNKNYESISSGRYMITALHHAFSGKDCYTALELVKDSYDIKTQLA